MDPLKAVVCGAKGRMGQRIIEAIFKTQGIELVQAVEIEEKVPGEIILPDGMTLELITPAEFRDVISTSIDVIIDFTSVEGTKEIVEVALFNHTPMVIGTTGLETAEVSRIKKLAETAPVVMAPNMSIGVNLLFAILPEIVRALSDYDVEIIELHHRLKKDAPSGTAMKLAEIIALNKWTHTCNKIVYGREGMIGERTDDEIGILSSRAGDIVGEHTVIFAGPGERIELIHRAHSRDTFAYGAVKAALFTVNKGPGFYTMQDVLGFKKS